MKKNILAENMRRFGTKNLQELDNRDFEGSGLIVIGRTQIDNNQIADMLDETDYHGIWNNREGYWFFPEDESTFSYLEADLDEEFAKRGINARFEGQFNAESGLEKLNIHIPNLAWQDQTRIIKWIERQDYDKKDYNIYEKGKDITINIDKLETFEIEEIKSYLKSQNYKFSTNM